MKLTEPKMYERFLAGDSSFDGRFFTGVTTTGIYCLPSCKARKPKRENVRFFATCEAAREAGFRACRKCHPDDFARGADPVLDSVEALVQEIRGAPGNFADARAIVRRSGFGTTRVFELFRQHFHTTPADLLLRARIAFAKRQLIGTERRLLQIAGDAGFESLSVFHAHFRELTGMTPAAYRLLRDAGEFAVALPKEYPLPYLYRALSRDAHSAVERLSGDTYETMVSLDGAPAALTLRFNANTVRVRFDVIESLKASPGSSLDSDSRRSAIREWLPLESSPIAPPIPGASSGRTSRAPAVAAHEIVTGLLGLDQDASAFIRLARRLGLSRLVSERPGLRISQTPSIFDGLMWAIIGQQINFSFACILKRRLIEKTGRPLDFKGTGILYLPPEPGDVAALSPEDLLPLQFSRKKAEYLIGASRLVAEGKLDLDALRSQSATRAERTLLEVHGLGPWSVNYLMMRSLGFADCVPLGDTGVTSGLQNLLNLEERPDIDATRRLMSVFSPYRSLATTHLWQLNKPAP